MSDDKLTTVAEPATDLTSEDLEKVKQYMEEGLPGIATIDSNKMARIMDLYLSGKTYRQISTMTRTSKTMILYLSHKFEWYTARKEYLEDLEASIRSRIIEAKIVNQDFLLQLTLMWQKKIGKKINEYLANGDEKAASEIDLKEVDKYLKTVDMLHRLSGEKAPNGGGTPAVGLNLGDGVTIERMGNNKVEITPKQKAIGDMLKQFADSRREEDKK